MGSGSDHPVLKTAKRLLYHGKNNMQVQEREHIKTTMRGRQGSLCMTVKI